MRRKTFIFGWLLLPVWLAVVANISFDASLDGVTPGSTQAAFSTATDQGQHGSSKDLPPIKHALHHPVRRALIPGETYGKPYELTDTIAVAPVVGQSDSTLLGVVKTPADILQSWNFNVRNAREPRAPSATSSVS
jgi:hypothetical protein